MTDDGLAERPSASLPVLDAVASPLQARRGRTIRRAGLAVLAVLVAVAAVGLLDPRDHTVSTRPSADAELSVQYSAVTRPGLDTEVQVRWSSGEQLDDEVVVLVDQSMYRDLGIERVTPQPRVQTSAGERLHLRFDPPRHEEFVVTFSGRLPARQTIGAHRFSVGIDGVNGSQLRARTWVLP